ncbi:MAG: hypothetical protein VXZ40_02810 [Nanoarchaeota archaeon]|nr:hypothetical protein [Nanoarchaeota archaeon]
MHYIKDIFEGNITEHAHNKFVRYSKGSFVGPLVNIKAMSSGVKVSASFHFVDELLMLATQVIGNRQVHVKGSLVWNSDLGRELEDLGIKYSKVTKSRGIFKYVLDNEVPFKEFVNTFGSYHLLLTVKEDDLTFVTKSSFPKPNKEFGPDFVKAKFPKDFAEKIMGEFAFDCPLKTKEIKISHHINIDDIELPKDSKNFEEARKLAIRKGSIIRITEIDGESKEQTIDVEV